MNLQYKKVFVLGAFDRYNYGDLLFPYIIQHQFENNIPGIQLEYFGLVKSDLSMVGGKQTLDIKTFNKRCNGAGDKDIIVIIAGGETLKVSWSGLYSFLNSSFRFFNRRLGKFSYFINLNWFARIFLRGRTYLPLAFSKDRFSRVRLVIGNSLGGSNLHPSYLDKHKKIVKELRKIDYLAVRDTTTSTILKQFGIDSALIPDSAILMSKIYNRMSLKEMVGKEVASFASFGKYIFFQVSKAYYEDNEIDIIEQLEEVHQTTGFTVCLCPIGFALGHEDQVALGDINQKLKIRRRLFLNITIWDIMYLIAKSECYIGTSLHGLITAMSFCRPYVGLNKDIIKLRSYLESWGVNELKQCASFDNFSTNVKQALDVKPEEIRNKTNEQTELVEKSFSRMFNLIN